MSNVKPGDLARVVVDEGNQGFLGAQVSVLGLPGAAWRHNLKLLLPKLHWECQLLETRSAKLWMYGEPELVSAGRLILCPDDVLKRIDPPADTEQLYSTAPIEGESLKEYDHVQTT